MTTRTRRSATWVYLTIAILLAAGAIVALRPGILPGPGGPGRSQSKVYEFVVNYQNIPGGVNVKIHHNGTTTGIHLTERSGFVGPHYYTSRGTVSLDAAPTHPGPGGTAIGQYQLIATITLYQYGQIVNVWEDSATERNDPVRADTALPPTG